MVRNNLFGLLRWIAGYYRTDHFIERQWQRKIPDMIICLAMQNVRIESKNAHVIISISKLKTWCLLHGLKCRTNEELVICIKANHLTTVYQKRIHMGQFIHHKNHETILIQ